MLCSLCKLAHQIPRKIALAEGNLHPGVSKYGSRRPVEARVEAQGMETPSRIRGAHLEKVWSSSCWPVCVWGDDTLPIVVLPLTPNSTGVRCHGADVAKVLSEGFSHKCSAPRSSTESPPERSMFAPGSPAWIWSSDLIALLDILPWEIPIRRDLLTQARDTIYHHHPNRWKLRVWPLGRSVHIWRSLGWGHWKLYALKWRMFTLWCGECQLDPVNGAMASVLEFLQDHVFWWSYPVHTKSMW